MGVWKASAELETSLEVDTRREELSIHNKHACIFICLKFAQNDAVFTGGRGRGGGKGSVFKTGKPVMVLSQAVKDSPYQHLKNRGCYLRGVRADRGRLRDGELDSAFLPCSLCSVTSCGSTQARLSCRDVVVAGDGGVEGGWCLVFLLEASAEKQSDRGVEGLLSVLGTLGAESILQTLATSSACSQSLSSWSLTGFI